MTPFYRFSIISTGLFPGGGIGSTTFYATGAGVLARSSSPPCWRPTPTITYLPGLPLLLFLLVIAVCLSWLFRAPFSATRLLPRFGPPVARSTTVVVRNLSRRVQNGLTLLENWPIPGHRLRLDGRATCGAEAAPLLSIQRHRH